MNITLIKDGTPILKYRLEINGKFVMIKLDAAVKSALLAELAKAPVNTEVKVSA